VDELQAVAPEEQEIMPGLVDIPFEEEKKDEL
jgi:hypothetical protein